ncbi:hypothetical protein [Labrenzia sp. DG1229]|uniref:hypothetical protein n=1 Tax=Labrenzia sp. DG1229 TaxID=681847 RepID=UPI000AB16056|nr:hypothetical protein [Labrenzia sp. DG1229]
MTETKSKLTPKAIMAASSGNVLEWYDFTVYGFLAPTLATLFFRRRTSWPRSCLPLRFSRSAMPHGRSEV